MNIPIAMTLKGFNDSTNTDYVPDVGEVVVNRETNELKIGDGKTRIADLPYIDTHVGVDLATEPAKFEPSNIAKDFVKKHKDLIASNNFDEFYKQLECASIFLVRDVTQMLLEAGINVREHLTTVPRRIQDMLLGEPEVYECQIEDFSYYTTAEINARLHEVTEEVTKKMYNAMSIPAHLMTIKTGDN